MHNAAKSEIVEKDHLRFLSYNIQGGIETQAYRHYLMKSWQHVLPHAHKRDNLDQVARLISSYDIVGLQETDAGSFRSNFMNQTEYLANKAHFPYWYYQVNRNIGKLAQHSNGLLCRYKPVSVSEYKLPGLIPGRGALMARFRLAGQYVTVITVHLALGRKTRRQQISFLSELIQSERNVVLMGDLNCDSDSREMKQLFLNTHMRQPEEKPSTFPSWQPKRNIDHILISEGLKITRVDVLSQGVSDHLPVSIDIRL